MVKGITRRVIVVKSPDPRYFEEAIFIVKEDVSVAGVDADAVVDEAKTVAQTYLRREDEKRSIIRKIPRLAYTALGAVGTFLVMFLL